MYFKLLFDIYANFYFYYKIKFNGIVNLWNLNSRDYMCIEIFESLNSKCKF